MVTKEHHRNTYVILPIKGTSYNKTLIDTGKITLEGDNKVHKNIPKAYDRLESLTTSAGLLSHGF